MLLFFFPITATEHLWWENSRFIFDSCKHWRLGGHGSLCDNRADVNLRSAPLTFELGFSFLIYIFLRNVHRNSIHYSKFVRKSFSFCCTGKIYVLNVTSVLGSHMLPIRPGLNVHRHEILKWEKFRIFVWGYFSKYFAKSFQNLLKIFDFEF